MAIVRAMVTFPADSSDTEDVIVNNWGFDAVATAAGVVNAHTALDAFYTTLVTYFSSAYDYTAATIKWYNMLDPEPRVPFETSLLNVAGSPSANLLPTECCVCLSFQGYPTSGTSQARRRGRIYLPPMGVNAMAASGGLVLASLVTLIAGTANTLMTTGAGSDFDWIVISKTPSINAVLVTNGWVDNAWDTQRRRGFDATTRVEFG
jgi:hypothetical protein